MPTQEQSSSAACDRVKYRKTIDWSTAFQPQKLNSPRDQMSTLSSMVHLEATSKSSGALYGAVHMRSASSWAIGMLFPSVEGGRDAQVLAMCSQDGPAAAEVQPGKCACMDDL